MKTICLVGGVASGKSLAAQALINLGAGLLDADRTGHAVLAEDAGVQAALRQRWGNAVFTPAGQVDRSALACRVFSEDNAGTVDREFLENLLHPRIRRRLEKLRDQFAADGKPAAVLDAPLLLEAGWTPMCDIVLMIDAPREARLEWARQRGWTDAEFAGREAAQWPVEEKRRAADVVIANDGTIDKLRDAVRRFWEQNVSPSRGESQS
ncbi:MAG: dephospho-CoA kinase [Pirellulales bacterium]